MKARLYRTFIRLLPSLFYRIQHLRIHIKYGNHHYWANLKNPRTFNEHILKDKLSLNRRKYSDLVDKYLVKNVVKEMIGKQYVIPTFAYIDSLEKLNVSDIRFPCIMKPTHLSGYVKIYMTPEDLDIGEFKNMFSSFGKKNLYDLTGESQYRDLKPGVLFEELLYDPSGDLKDYKFFCFNGRVEAIQVDFNRLTNHTRSFYSKGWQNLGFSTMYPLHPDDIDVPVQLAKMLEIAETLSVNHKFMRVDLYNVNEKIYFGELTFHHGSGYEPFTTYKDDLWLGKFLGAS